MIPFTEWMAGIQQRTERALDAHLPANTIAPVRLHEAMRYAVLGGGKRVRPLLCQATGAALTASVDAIELASCSVELIHAYSLVHDDLPCMDNDVLRRGKPTCHVAFDEATALLVGDALQTLAFRLLSTPIPEMDPARQLTMVKLLADASGSRGMAGGQAIDLAAVGQQLTITELEYMHLHKTGALIRASILLGALRGKASEHQLDALTRYSNRVGLLFQVVDDILDDEADTATLGKTAGKDAAANKPTFCTLSGISRAKELANELRSGAHQALAELTRSGCDCTRLAQLTDFIVERRH